MLNRSASLAVSTSVLKALPGKLDIKRHSPSILYFCEKYVLSCCHNTKMIRSAHRHLSLVVVPFNRSSLSFEQLSNRLFSQTIILHQREDVSIYCTAIFN